MNSTVRDEQASSFGRAAEVYDRARPGYPPEALDWLLQAGAARVLDLGAGTGKLTAMLLDRCPEVVAVEPSEGMRRQLQRALPSVRCLPGSAEAIPLPDGCVDAVLVAQAWHWVDGARAVPEVARVLKRDRTLGLLWNVRDDSVDWVRDLESILRRGSEQQMNTTEPTVGAPFGSLERMDISWTYTIPSGPSVNWSGG